ncbi:MAG: IS30 family transposase [Cellvibrionaceae bacterium]|jgi:IS30 family transposase
MTTTIKTLTLDNGTEFAAYGLLSQSLGAKVFFCEPYKSYQKGAIENANKLIRTKLPNGVVRNHNKRSRHYPEYQPQRELLG